MSDPVALWTAACQSPVSSIIAQSLLRFMCIESVMFSNHVILCHLLLLLCLCKHQGLSQWVGSLHHVSKHLGSANYTTLSNDLLSSELENFTCKGPGSKYFRLGGPWQSVGTIQVDCYSPEAAIDDGRACAPITFYLWMLKFEFHIIFTPYKILSSVAFSPNHLKMWKPFLADGPYKNKWWAEFGLESIIHQSLL